MAYSSWSVVYGEVPSAAKWNILGTNDASFNDGTGIAGLYKNLLTVDSNPYKFSAYKSGAQNLVSGNVTKVTFATEEYDTNNNFASSTYTAPVAGFYYFGSTIKAAMTAANAYFIMIYKNGSEFKRGIEIIPGYTNSFGLTVDSVLQLAANDTIDIYAYSGTGTGAIATGQNSGYFCGFLISRT